MTFDNKGQFSGYANDGSSNIHGRATAPQATGTDDFEDISPGTLYPPHYTCDRPHMTIHPLDPADAGIHFERLSVDQPPYMTGIFLYAQGNFTMFKLKSPCSKVRIGCSAASAAMYPVNFIAKNNFGYIAASANFGGIPQGFVELVASAGTLIDYIEVTGNGVLVDNFTFTA